MRQAPTFAWGGAVSQAWLHDMHACLLGCWRVKGLWSYSGRGKKGCVAGREVGKSKVFSEHRMVSLRLIVAKTAEQ